MQAYNENEDVKEMSNLLKTIVLENMASTIKAGCGEYYGISKTPVEMILHNYAKNYNRLKIIKLLCQYQ